MRIVLTLFLSVITVLISGSGDCQPFNATEMMSAREAARGHLMRNAEIMQESQKSQELALKEFALSRNRMGKLAGANLGDAFLVYDIGKEGIDRLTKLDDIYTVAEFIWVEFPVLVDDDLTLSISVIPAVDSTTKEIIWKRGRFGGANGIGKRCAELSERYPEAQGYEMIQLYLNGEADFIIFRKASDYIIFYGFRDFGGHTWPDYKDDFNRIISTKEFMETLKSYASTQQERGHF